MNTFIQQGGFKFIKSDSKDFLLIKVTMEKIV